MTHVVGKDYTEYDSERLKESIQQIAVANCTPIGTAENFALNVVQKIKQWIDDKAEITPTELRLQTAEALAKYDPDAAYLYENENNFF